MKVTVRDPEAFQALSPRNVVQYLAVNGWSQTSERPGLFTIWQNGPATVLVPVSPDLSDYALRLAETVQTLEEHEERPQTAIINDIRRTFADIIRVRREEEGWAGEEIPIDAGVALVEHARNMVLAAACTAAVPRSFYPTRKPDPATRYIKRVRMGQTEAGSYVVTLISPLYVNAQIVEDIRSEPFERRVTRTLAERVALASAAALESDETHNVDSLVQLLDNRELSTNLCDALAGLTEETGAARVDIGVRWAPGSGLSAPRVRQTVTIVQRAVPALKEASRIIKERLAFDDYPLAGYITDLHGDLQLQRDSHRPSGGTITVATYVEGVPRKVDVRLDFEQYEKAARAHTSGVLFRATGELRREGRSLLLLDPRDVIFEFAEQG
jgi:hypothetical protein